VSHCVCYSLRNNMF